MATFKLPYGCKVHYIDYKKNISKKEIMKMIDHSYDLVVKGLPKGKKAVKKKTATKK